jgi:hypothetical protein
LYPDDSSIVPCTNLGTAEQQLIEWIFHLVTGRLEAKKIAGAITAAFTYTPGVRILTKTGGRNLSTSYAYNSAGQVQSVAYSDGLTPNVVMTYRRSGEVHTVTHAGSTYTYDYGLPGEMEQTSITGGVLDGVVIDPAYDALHPPSALQPRGLWQWHRRDQPGLDLRARLLPPPECEPGGCRRHLQLFGQWEPD